MKKKILAIVSLAALTALPYAGGLYAQDAAPAANPATPAAADASKPVVKEKTLMDMWRAGGITMYPLGLLAIFAMTLVVYNGIAVRRKKFLNPDGVKKLEGMLNELKIADAVEFCEKNPSPITNIVGAGLARANQNEISYEAIEQAMEEASVEELAAPYVLINYLSVIASLAPMLGLYGTVSGMVKAFNTIAAEGAGSAAKLADNISEALITTAAGMIIGMPAMFFFFFYKNKFGSITSSTSRIIGDLIFILKTSLKFGPQDLSEESKKAEQAQEPVNAEPAK